MKRWIQRKHPKNLQELDKLVNEAFTALCDEEYCKKLYALMLKRLEMVIENRGFRIKY